MIRPYKGVQALGAASQPVFGTTMNGAGVMTKDPYTQNTLPGSNPSSTVLPVVSVVGMKTGDHVLVGLKAAFVSGGALDLGIIQSINTVTPSITVSGLQSAHASGEYVVVNEDAMKVWVEPVTSTNPMYLGNASTVAAADPSVFWVVNLPTGANPYLSATDLADTLKTSEFWIDGTSGDTFVAGFMQA
jgi:hypothetical protein